MGILDSKNCYGDLSSEVVEISLEKCDMARERYGVDFYRHNWYYIGVFLFFALSFFMGFWGVTNLTWIQVILTFSFMAMLVHQFEEYAYPGGFPAISNGAIFGAKNYSDRYPLNANQCMISNVFLTYPFYIAAISFPNFIWLGLVQVGLGMFQIVAHGIATPVRLKALYNPGLASTVLLFLPIGLYYIWYVVTNNLATTEDFVLGVIGTAIAAVALFLLPILLLRSKESRYPFSEAEMTGLAKQKPEKIGNS